MCVYVLCFRYPYLYMYVSDCMRMHIFSSRKLTHREPCSLYVFVKQYDFLPRTSPHPAFAFPGIQMGARIICMTLKESKNELRIISKLKCAAYEETSMGIRAV